uniref:Gastrula zinc finger protein XlCGF7.1-like isoform X4 n=1 Tax=Diabrotica virgifera virgifera TaxID=50390 RepID=A0A6P7GQV6_DIAVI
MEPDKIKVEQIEVKQEVSEETFKEEIDNVYEMGDDLFDTFKIEIKEELKREIITNDDAFECSLLNENAMKTEIKQDEEKHTNEKSFPYGDVQTDTNKVFKEHGIANSNLEEYVTAHKPITCEICCKMFSRKGNLKEHMKIHTEDKLFLCEICSKTFSRRHYLKEHMRIHTGDKPFTCETCSYRFSRKSSLKTHMRIHTEEIHTGKSFTCKICTKEFPHNSVLRVHMKIHTVRHKPFACEVCSKLFASKSSLKEHTIIRHTTGVKPFECEVCSKSFSRRSDLKVHIHIAHNVRWTSI